MALITPEQYEESLRTRKSPRIFMNGRRAKDVFDNSNIRTVIEANKASYRWALDPQYQDLMTVISPVTDDRVNRYVYVCRNREDLVAKAIAGTFTAERLGTCIYRCPGLDAFHALASTTWEMDKDLLADDVYELGNPVFGQRETSMVVFDNGKCVEAQYL